MSRALKIIELARHHSENREDNINFNNFLPQTDGTISTAVDPIINKPSSGILSEVVNDFDIIENVEFEIIGNPPDFAVDQMELRYSLPLEFRDFSSPAPLLNILVPYSDHSDSDVSSDYPEKSIKRKRRSQVNKVTWFGEKNKKLREKGQKYFGRVKINEKWNYKEAKTSRKMKNRCTCIQRENGKIKCASITEDERNGIFKAFWNLTWGEKKTYINNLVVSLPTKRYRDRRNADVSKRLQSLIYYLRVKDNNIRVCRTMFLNTLNVGRWSILQWKNISLSREPTCQRVTKENRVQPYAKENRELFTFIDSLPVMESHYCRASSTKKYLLPEWSSKQSLYRFYVNDWCKTRNVKALSIASFSHSLDRHNIDFFRPKKDQCEKCAAYKVGQISEDVYQVHILKKNEARDEKANDKQDRNTLVFTTDLQAVLMAPKSNISSLYYRTKLQVHNLCFYNLNSKDGFCFLWNESEGGVNAEEFASVWIYFLENKVLPHIGEAKKIIMYSDGCNYQNRNCVMSNALLNLAITHNIVIEQKYLETGHTQMEADSMHSTIERYLRTKNINVPAEYVQICKMARKIPHPYDVKYINFDFFKKFEKVEFCKSIRPGRNKGDAKVTDIRALQYTPRGEIFYKLRFGNTWEILPQRISKNIAPCLWNDLSSLHQSRRQISARKFDDLQYLKQTLPSDYRCYYDNLPHE